MKKNILYLSFLTLICGFFASGCLYEEGPFFSFNSPEFRIAFNWQFDKVTYNKNSSVLLANNKDSINYGASFLSFDQTGRFAFIISSLKVQKKGVFLHTGNWAFENDKKDFRMKYDDNAYPERSFRIVKLTENDFRFRYTEGDDNTIFYMKPKK
jgi:hypothetical protein